MSCGIWYWSAYVAGIRVVDTPSVPPGIWWVHRGTITRGTYVLACLPLRLAEFGRARRYLDGGTCAGGAAPVMKRVVALPGDLVVVERTRILVNGEPLLRSARIDRDHEGRSMNGSGVTHMTRVRAGEVWLLGDWSRSWDSRYYGGVTAAGILGLGTPLLVQNAGTPGTDTGTHHG